MRVADWQAWLDGGCAEVARDPARLDALFPSVTRRVGRAQDVAARTSLLLAAAGAEGAAVLERASRLYFQGDLRERIGILRALPALPDGPAALPAVLDACRQNVLEIFEAAIAENDYASRHLPDADFRNAVLKCAFVGVPLHRAARVLDRASEELTRMLVGFASERELAGRPTPPDLWPVAAARPIPGLRARLIGLLEHGSDEHRLAAAAALTRMRAVEARPFVAERLSRERDPRVLAALERALAAMESA